MEQLEFKMFDDSAMLADIIMPFALNGASTLTVHPRTADGEVMPPVAVDDWKTAYSVGMVGVFNFGAYVNIIYSPNTGVISLLSTYSKGSGRVKSMLVPVKECLNNLSRNGVRYIASCAFTALEGGTPEHVHADTLAAAILRTIRAIEARYIKANADKQAEKPRSIAALARLHVGK